MRRPFRTSSTRIEPRLLFVTTNENCGRVPAFNVVGVAVTTVTSAARQAGAAVGDGLWAADTDTYPVTMQPNTNLPIILVCARLTVY